MGSYFLGESSSSGYRTDIDRIIFDGEYFTYILKGGAGTGKSTLMKKIAEKFSESDETDLYYCSSDPTSLDAVVLNKRKIAVIDGTSPHVFDPVYPGVSQSIINLGEFWDSSKLLDSKDEIITVTKENSEWHKRCKRYISAVSSINSDILTIASDAVKYEKLDGFISRFTKKHFPTKKDQTGTKQYKKLSALTGKGYTTHKTEYSDIYILHDTFSAGAEYFLTKIAENASLRGYNVIISKSGLFNSTVYEHILIPELSLSLMTSNHINGLDIEGNPINFKRFYCPEKLKSRKERLAFSIKASAELMSEGAKCFRRAGEIHDKIEKYYISAVDFRKIDKITSKLISSIEKMPL